MSPGPPSSANTRLSDSALLNFKEPCPWSSHSLDKASTFHYGKSIMIALFIQNHCVFQASVVYFTFLNVRLYCLILKNHTILLMPSLLISVICKDISIKTFL